MENIKVCILNYGSGNTKSVFNILKYLNANVIISNSPEDIKSSTHLILPGVGSFGSSIEKIRMNIPVEIVENEVLNYKKPFLGICVGMQVLAEKGYEFGTFKGLGWIPGEVKKIESGKSPLPHLGWNSIEIIKDVQLLSSFKSNQDFYFVHSFAVETDDNYIIAETEYGQEFTSIIVKENICGVQFHPEKSQKAGKILLENFLYI